MQRGMLKKHHGFRVGYYGQPNTIIGRRMTKEDKCKNKKKRIIFSRNKLCWNLNER